MAYQDRLWIDREVVTAAKLNDMERRVRAGLDSVVTDVADDDVAVLVADQYSETGVALHNRIAGWVADGTIPQAQAPDITVAETQDGVYEIGSAGVVYGLNSSRKLPSAAKSDLATDISTAGTTIRNALDEAVMGQGGASDADVAGLVGDPGSQTRATLETVIGNSTGGQGRTVPAVSLSVLPGLLSGQSGYSGRSYTQDSVTTGGGYRYAAWYSETGTLLVGRRPVGQSGAWETFDLATISGNPLVLPVDNDSHNTVSIHLDSSGRLHVAANMHGDRLRYVRANLAWQITSWSAPPMVGTEEDFVTYPRFARTPDGTLFMSYRNGSSGSGDVYLNRYSVNGGTWTRVGMIAQGAAYNESPYEARFVAASDGSLNFAFTWRPNGGAFDTNNDVHFIRSYDKGATWQAVNGAAVTLPLLHSNTTAMVLNTADSGSGIANQFGLDVDPQGRPHIALHLLNGTPHRNIYHVYWSGSQWVTQQATFLANNNVSGTAPARPSIACTNSGRTVILTKYATGPQKGLPMLIDVTGDPVEAPIADIDLREWELTYDGLALRERDELVVMVSTVNGDISSPAADYHSVSNWNSQWGGVLVVDVPQVNTLLRREAILPHIKILTTITTPDNVQVSTTTDSLVGNRYIPAPDLYGRKVMVRYTARASATAGQTMTMQIGELEQDGPSRKFAAIPFNTSFTAIKSSPWMPLAYGPINSKSTQVYMVAKVDGGTGTVASAALEIGVISGPVF